VFHGGEGGAAQRDAGRPAQAPRRAPCSTSSSTTSLLPPAVTRSCATRCPCPPPARPLPRASQMPTTAAAEEDQGERVSLMALLEQTDRQWSAGGGDGQVGGRRVLLRVHGLHPLRPHLLSRLRPRAPRRPPLCNARSGEEGVDGERSLCLTRSGDKDSLHW
jgi:hypothetical protein